MRKKKNQQSVVSRKQPEKRARRGTGHQTLSNTTSSSSKMRNEGGPLDLATQKTLDLLTHAILVNKNGGKILSSEGLRDSEKRSADGG